VAQYVNHKIEIMISVNVYEMLFRRKEFPSEEIPNVVDRMITRQLSDDFIYPKREDYSIYYITISRKANQKLKYLQYHYGIHTKNEVIWRLMNGT